MFERLRDLIYVYLCKNITLELLLYGMLVIPHIQSYNQVLIMSNQFVELSEEEKAEARKEAFKQYQAEELRKLRNRQTKTIEKKKAQIQPSLFDF